MYVYMHGECLYDCHTDTQQIFFSFSGWPIHVGGTKNQCMCNAWTGPSHVTRYNASALTWYVKQLIYFHVFNNKCFISNCMSTPGSLSLSSYFLSKLSFAVTITLDKLVGKLYTHHIGECMHWLYYRKENIYSMTINMVGIKSNVS